MPNKNDVISISQITNTISNSQDLPTASAVYTETSNLQNEINDIKTSMVYWGTYAYPTKPTTNNPEEAMYQVDLGDTFDWVQVRKLNIHDNDSYYFKYRDYDDTQWGDFSYEYSDTERGCSYGFIIAQGHSIKENVYEIDLGSNKTYITAKLEGNILKVNSVYDNYDEKDYGETKYADDINMKWDYIDRGATYLWIGGKSS